MTVLAPEAPRSVVAQTLEEVAMGLPVRRHNLILVPLLRPWAGAPQYLTARRALRAGLLEITEVSDGGTVNAVRATNRADQPVLVLDGEELVGARQNRIANVSVLIAARSTVRLPVSCVEQRRWAWRTRFFADSRQTMPPCAHRQHIRAVHETLRRSGSFQGDQAAVWLAVDEQARRLRVRAPTLALDEVYAGHEARLARYEDGVDAQRDQIGALFAINGEFVSVQLFDAATTFAELQLKLVRSHALEALQREDESDALAEPGAAAADRFLAALSEAPVSRFAGVGLGENLRLESQAVTGSALVVEDRLVHLVAYAG
ncbi:MAG TPA: DUF6569 family protein [Gemmatimonadales bacterium]|jgi:hypothetical protein|nr:DUF6569 family protein [Gemmatimonadales bacterium]